MNVSQVRSVEEGLWAIFKVLEDSGKLEEVLSGVDWSNVGGFDTHKVSKKDILTWYVDSTVCYNHRKKVREEEANKAKALEKLKEKLTKEEIKLLGLK
jgi:hypothetical protein